MAKLEVAVPVPFVPGAEQNECSRGSHQLIAWRQRLLRRGEGRIIHAEWNEARHEKQSKDDLDHEGKLVARGQAGVYSEQRFLSALAGGLDVPATAFKKAARHTLAVAKHIADGELRLCIVLVRSLA